MVGTVSAWLFGTPDRPRDASRIARREIANAAALARVATDDEDVAIAERVRGGDVAAFEALFRRYGHQLHTFASAYLRSPHLAEDVVQDVFTRIWEDRAEWRVQTTVRQYLFASARNRAIDLARRDATTTRREEDFAHEEIASETSSVGTSRLEAAELGRYVAQAVQALPPRCREVFLLSRVEHLSQREIALALGIALPTVKIQLSKAFRAIEAACRAYRNTD